MKVFTYSRVSTDKQSHDSQLIELREYCQRRGWSVRMELVDTASGAKVSRSGLEELMTLVRAGRVDVIVCYKLDRLGRSLAHLAQIIGELTRHRVALVIPSQGIDTSSSNPAAQLQLNILCAVAEFEREVIRERVKAGLAAARARGKRLGPTNKIDALLPLATELVANGASVARMSRELGISTGSAWKLARTARAKQAETAALQSTALS